MKTTYRSHRTTNWGGLQHQRQSVHSILTHRGMIRGRAKKVRLGLIALHLNYFSETRKAGAR